MKRYASRNVTVYGPAVGLGVAVGQLVPDRPQRAEAAQLAHGGDQHGDTGEELDDELPEFRERVGPQPADRAVHGGDGARDEDALGQGDAREDGEQRGDGRPLGADVHDLQQQTGPGEGLLGLDVVAVLEVFERRGDVQPRTQPVEPGREELGADADADRDRQGPGHEGRDAVLVRDTRVAGEHHRAVTGHVVRDARQPPRHLAAGCEEVADVVHALVRPESDRDHHTEVADEHGPVETVHVPPPGVRLVNGNALRQYGRSAGPRAGTGTSGIEPPVRVLGQGFRRSGM